MDDEIRLRVELPLDTDGFLRRECEACGREFKWFQTEAGEGEPEPEEDYFCPYCRNREGNWLTEDQREYATAKAGEAAAKELRSGLEGSSRSRGFGIDITVDGPTAGPLREPNDMRRVDPSCHPKEPLKVLDGWNGEVHCLICGKRI